MTRPSLRDGFTLIRSLPGAPGFLATIAHAKNCTSVIPASGYQDAATSRPQPDSARLALPSAATAPHPTYRDDAYVPLRRGGMRGENHNFRKSATDLFFSEFKVRARTRGFGVMSVQAEHPASTSGH